MIHDFRRLRKTFFINFSIQHQTFLLFSLFMPAALYSYQKKHSTQKHSSKESAPAPAKVQEALSFITYRAGTIQLQEEIFPGQQN